MFQVKDLMGDILKGRYYKEQLRKAPIPGVTYQFEVQKNKENGLFLVVSF
jgi:hypothetical protein